MKGSMLGAAVAVLFVVTPVLAQESRPVNVEMGVVMGIISQPYATVGITRAPWVVRASGGGVRHDCYGLQLNVGRIVRDEGNTKHTMGAMWAGFDIRCYYGGQPGKAPVHGQYAGLVYGFQAKGFFLEAGPGVGVRNPFLGGIDLGPLNHIYGQIGYVHRFGKKYVDDEDR